MRIGRSRRERKKKVICRCGYEWFYKPRNAIFRKIVVCPSCRSAVRISGDKYA